MLAQLQNELACLYEIDAPCDINQFLIQDRATVAALNLPIAQQAAQEQLLICQDSEQVNIALYIDRAVLTVLQQAVAKPGINTEQLNAYWLAIEGVSHFLYLTWRLQHQRPVTQLELELQAEVDKFICTTYLLSQQLSPEYMPDVHTALFANTLLHQKLTAEQRVRYRTANRYAAKYCLALHKQLQRSGVVAHCINELRRFYRLSQQDKLRRINSLH